MTEKEKEALETTLTALDVALDIANTLLTDGLTQAATSHVEARKDLRLLRNYVAYMRERLQEGEAEHG